MSKTRWLSIAALLGVLGCGGGDAPGDGGPSGGEADGAPRDGGGTSTGATYFYVVSRADLPAPTGNTAVGFDVDGLSSDGDDATTADRMCTPEAADYTSPSGTSGIDNQLAGILPGVESFIDDPDTTTVETLSSVLADIIHFGFFLLLAEVSGVDDLVNDDSVTLSFYIGAPPEGELGPALTGEGELEAGQTFDLNEGLMRGAGPIATIPGRITEGVLHVGPGEAMIVLGTATPVSLPLHDVELEARITATSLSDGVLGGKLVGDELLEAFRNSGLATLQRVAGVAEVLLDARVDLPPVAADGTCQAISAAATFSGISAVRGVLRDPSPDE